MCLLDGAIATLLSKQTVYTGTEQVYLTACSEWPCCFTYYIFYCEHYALWHPVCPKISKKRKVDAE